MNKYLQMIGGGIVIDVTVRGNMNTAKTALLQNGFKVTGEYGRVISGVLPVGSLPQIESIAAIQYARPAFKPIHPTRSPHSAVNDKNHGNQPVPVISQGDTAELSFLARKKYNVNGKGVKVGIMSDSYNNLGTANKGIKAGELPGAGNPFHFNKPVEVLRWNR
jgi:hypothetical protein